MNYNIEEILERNEEMDNVKHEYSENNSLILTLPIENCINLEREKWGQYLGDAVRKYAMDKHNEIYQHVGKLQVEEKEGQT